MARTPLFSTPSLLRIVSGLLAGELSRSRGLSSAALGVSNWRFDTRLDRAGLGLDSLERLDGSSALSEFFHLHEHGAEDYLLTLPTLGDWCDLVAASLQATGTHLTFRTSGTSGAPKRCTHAVSDLMEEIAQWAAMLGPVNTIVSMTPSHHLYGTVFTALLPDHLGVGVEWALTRAASALASSEPGAVVVATPTLWRHVARACPAIPPGVTGVSSTAPMPAALAEQLAAQGLDRLIEVYGSSESGGVGYRTDATSPFVLLDQWRHAGDGVLVRGDGTRHTLMDESRWLDSRRFRLGGRRDGAVQVGGANVFPDVVRERLLTHEAIIDAAVRLEPASGRLKAFLVPSAGADQARLVEAVDDWCGRRFRDVERPRSFTLGSELPHDGMGKPVDW